MSFAILETFLISFLLRDSLLSSLLSSQLREQFKEWFSIGRAQMTLSLLGGTRLPHGSVNAHSLPCVGVSLPTDVVDEFRAQRAKYMWVPCDRATAVKFDASDNLIAGAKRRKIGQLALS